MEGPEELKKTRQRELLEIALSFVAVIASSLAAVGAFLTAFYEMQHNDLERRPAVHLTCRPEYRLAEAAQHLAAPEDTLLLTTSGGRIIHFSGDPGQAHSAVGFPEPFARCSVQNFGKLPMFDLRIPLGLSFTSSSGAVQTARADLEIPGLSSDATYEFLMLNGSSDDLRFRFEREIELSSVDMSEGAKGHLFTDEQLAEMERTTVPSEKSIEASDRVMSGRVTIRNFAYEPPELHVSRGATVTFVNTDAEAHTVAASDHSFDSGTIDAGAVWRHTFPRAGRFVFRCAFHPYMRGTIVVR